MPDEELWCPDLQFICRRVRQKRDSYVSYQFTREQNDILKTFFDLAQEFDTLQDFYRICVAVPSIYLGLRASLYLLNSGTTGLELVCDSDRGICPEPLTAPEYVRFSGEPYAHGESYLVPICRR